MHALVAQAGRLGPLQPSPDPGLSGWAIFAIVVGVLVATAIGISLARYLWLKGNMASGPTPSGPEAWQGTRTPTE